MKKIYVLTLVILLFSSSTYAAKITIGACDPSGNALVVLAGADGKWLGFSAKTNKGEIIDLTPVLIKDVGWAGSGSKNFSFSGYKGIVSVRASTWKSFDKKSNSMETRLDDTGWVACP